MQHRLEQVIAENLHQTHRDRAQFFSSVIQQRTVLAQTITTRPNALAQLRKALSDPNDPVITGQLQAVAASYLPHGFSWVAFHQNRRALAEVGVPLSGPRLEVSLHGQHKRELVWRDGYYLRTRLPLRDAHGFVGTAIMEQPLEVLDQLAADTNQLGQTGEMVICDVSKNPFRCFPERFLKQPFDLPHTVDGIRTPMARVLDGKSGTVSALDFRKQQVMAAYGPVGDTGLGMVLKTDWSEMYAPVREQLHWTLLVLVAFVALSLWLVRSHLQPLLQLIIGSRQAALTNEARFLAAAENNPDGFYLLESVRDAGNAITDFRFVFLNENGVRLVSSLPKEQFIGKTLSEMLPWMRDHGYLQKCRHVAETNEPLTDEFQIEAPGVKASWLSSYAARLGDGVAITLRDISERKNAEQELRSMAESDPLTGLANRASFMERLRHAMAHAAGRARPMALLYLDIDHFKRINDTLGHAAGDELLRTIALRLQDSVRTTDTVARLGGDEFTVVLSEMRDAGDAEVVARKVGNAVRQPLILEGRTLTITSSIGIVLYRGESLEASDLIRRADEALYRAKTEGRDRFMFSYPPET
jgi:diguanylate cyclase (GGDEF)-like protein